ncbi:helix-turn-helix domain-containing protein [Tenacibaculum maritimum]|uniref:helix-turn-helix domain-containing protein n=1 Tax=Tenacibaculum maritimum TaxID=107401 RepID=UPI00387697DD
MKPLKITQIQGIDATELLTQFQNLHAELIALKQGTNKVDTNKDKLLTRKQTAEILSVSLPTIWSWGKKGIIKAYRIGNKIRFKESEVMEALQEINAKKSTGNE